MKPSQEIPWWRPEVGEEEIALVAAVLRTNYLNEGDVTEELERRVATLIGARFAVAVTSGTAALFLSLKAAGVGPGDEVIVPDVTFIATANAVMLAGATPVLVDVDETTLCLDPEAVEGALTGKTKAVIPVHVTGRGGTLEAVLAVARAHDLIVVEDAAEALMSRYRGKYLGTFGTTGCFSFSPNKTITTGQGGLVVTDSEAIYRRLRELKDQGRAARGTGGDDSHPVLGFNFKLTNVQSAIGMAQLDRLPARLERQRGIYRRYRDGLASVSQVRVFPFDVDGGETPQWTDLFAERRDELDAYLNSQGIRCRRFWHALHTQPPYHNCGVGLTRSRELVARALWLPSAFQLTDAEVDRVIAAVRTFYAGATV